MFIWMVAIFMGAVIGSFLNVVIYRLPLIMTGNREFNLCYPPSHCPNCRKFLLKKHSIPILSYIYYKGRCAWCGENIPFRYFFVEALVILFSIVGWMRFEPSINDYIGYFILLIYAIVIAFIDFDTWKIPNILTLSLMALGFVYNINNGFVSLEDSVLGSILTYTILRLFSIMTSWLYKTTTIGGGDVKYLTAIAAWFGVYCMPIIILSASFLTMSNIIGLKFMFGYKISRMKIQFGPSISIAVMSYALVVYDEPLYFMLKNHFY
ncbi:TPA: A24 family peptidase [Salmonella enterica subsp. enterica serovar Bahrenfeld]|nr:prepilin peptidase [Salmonella enterica]HAR9009679.1 prepilin peptidase [Salmonella enterica]HAR9317389.1 prepilin peptidase [Salmonella enterica]